MFRSIILPSVVICVLALPFIFDSAQSSNSPTQNSPLPPNTTIYQASHGGNRIPTLLPNAQTRLPQSNLMQSSSPINYQTVPSGNPAFANPNTLPIQQSDGFDRNRFSKNPAVSGKPTLIYPTDLPSNFPPTQPISSGVIPGMVPDYGSAQYFVLPGDANGPNFNAQPLPFVPVMDFAEILRFDLNPNWIKQRWNRVSTSPGEDGLQGFRVALVTGTNSWDLHGSLTYFVDTSHRVQRITFRGWTGDATKLVNFLSQYYGFQPKQTHWAGFYLAQKRRRSTGGLLMQHPAVITNNNPVQQLALIMELNNPNGSFELSEDFESLILGSQQGR